MGRRRKKDDGLPKRVYPKHGAFWYVTHKNEWHRLAALDDYSGMLTALGALLSRGEPLNTMELLWASYQAQVLHKLAKKTQTGRKNDMKWPLKVFGKVDPATIEPHHIWTYWRNRGETEQARHEIRAISALLTYARQAGARKTDNPCFKLGMAGAKPRDLYVTDEMFYAVRDIAPTMLGYAMDLAWCAGLDEGTIRRLERRHIIATGLLFERGKTAKRQLVEGEDLVEICRRALQEAPQFRRAIICRRDGRPFAANGIQTAWQRLMTRATSPGKNGEPPRLDPTLRYHFHDIRGKAGSEAESDEAASAMLGHGDVAVTRKHYRRLPQRSKALKILDRERG